jgi:hypothetical protein
MTPPTLLKKTHDRTAHPPCLAFPETPEASGNQSSR